MIAAHDVSPERKTAENLLQIVQADITYCEELGIIMVGYCTDNGGDARGMRIRLKRVKPKLTVPPCWGHQVRFKCRQASVLTGFTQSDQSYCRRGYRT
jgi:hypothetical protein